MNQESLREIKKIVDEFFKKTSFEIEAAVLPPEEKTIPIKIRTEEPKVLIGQNGQTLAEIQRLLKVVLSRKVPEQFYLDLDINDYKKKKIAYLKETARGIADEVSLTKTEKVLAPMPAFERRIIHLELAGRKNITTESMGQEPERRVVVRPYP
jgi:spoIIIJ-associated protein